MALCWFNSSVLQDPIRKARKVSCRTRCFQCDSPATYAITANGEASPFHHQSQGNRSYYGFFRASNSLRTCNTELLNQLPRSGRRPIILEVGLSSFQYVSLSIASLKNSKRDFSASPALKQTKSTYFVISISRCVLSFSWLGTSGLSIVSF